MKMAQTKSRASAKRSQGSKKSQSRSKASSSKTRDSANKTNGVGRVDSARQAVEHTAKDASQAVGHAASKAKVPLMTGGAALVGAAGGVALGMRQARRHRRGLSIPRRPQMKVDSGDLAKAAKEVGSFGAQMGQLASELRHNREAANSGKQQHRSPLEVVLEGLTARR
jgi:hypothetical protein